VKPSSIELRDLSSLSEIGQDAFVNFNGVVIFEGKCPYLKRIGEGAFFQIVSPLSKVTLSEMVSLVVIEQWAFRYFQGEIALSGRFELLAGIGFEAFFAAANPLNVINLQCISRNGLPFLDSELDENGEKEDSLTVPDLTLEEAAFHGYVGKQNTNPLPPGCGVYTCDAALGDVPLTKALYASIQTGELTDLFAAVTCIPTEAFMEFNSPLSLIEKMPNLISIGDRAFFRFGGGEFSFMALDYSYLPRLEHIGAEAFSQFDSEVTVAVIHMQGMPALISIGFNAFQTLIAPFLLLQVECACSNLELIGNTAFSTLEYGNTSFVKFTDLFRLRSIGDSAFHHFASRDSVTKHEVIFIGVSPLLTSIGKTAFR
jgi:hypothetical protein